MEKNIGGKSARLLSAISNLVFSIGMIIYFCVGTGKFLEVFTGIPKIYCSLIMVSVGLAYTLSSGLYGVVFTDLIQEILLIITSLYFIVTAFISIGDIDLPARFTTFTLPITVNIPKNPEYHFFAFCIIFWILKGILEGMGGLGGYMSQRYFSARNEREASLMTAEWIILLAFRWGFIISLAVLGLKVQSHITVNGITDSEKVLPEVINRLLPAGIKGIAITGLIAAAMSTFDSTINAGAAYWVKDIYQAFIKPEATSKQLMRMSYIASFSVAAIGVILSFIVPNINDIWSWIVTSLTAGMFIPLVLRWYWKRFNGYGYAIGTGVGILTSILAEIFIKPAFRYQIGPEIVNRMPPYISFALVSAITFIAAIIATYLTPATDNTVLTEFYNKVRPGGWWNSIRNQMDPQKIKQTIQENRRAILGVLIALPAQMCLFLSAMTLVLRQWHLFCINISVVIFCSAVLYFIWFKRLKD